MAYATLADVELDPSAPAIPQDAEPGVERLIEAVEAVLDRLVPSLADAVTAGDVSSVLARQVVVDAVVRRLHNPKGYKGEHAGEYGYYFDEGRTGRGGWFTDSELNLLRPGGRKLASSIRVNLASPVTTSGRLAALPDEVWTQ